MKNELEDLIELDFGKDKIDNETIFENTFKKYKLFIDTNFETTFLQTLYHDVPTLLLINYDFIDLNNDIKKLIKEMKKNNMIINNFHKSKKFIHKPWELKDKDDFKMGRDYPFPLVKHEIARVKALSAFKKIS